MFQERKAEMLHTHRHPPEPDVQLGRGRTRERVQDRDNSLRWQLLQQCQVKWQAASSSLAIEVSERSAGLSGGRWVPSHEVDDDGAGRGGAEHGQMKRPVVVDWTAGHHKRNPVCPPELKVRTPARTKQPGWYVEFESWVTHLVLEKCWD